MIELNYTKFGPDFFGFYIKDTKTQEIVDTGLLSYSKMVARVNVEAKVAKTTAIAYNPNPDTLFEEIERVYNKSTANDFIRYTNLFEISYDTYILVKDSNNWAKVYNAYYAYESEYQRVCLIYMSILAHQHTKLIDVIAFMHDAIVEEHDVLKEAFLDKMEKMGINIYEYRPFNNDIEDYDNDYDYDDYDDDSYLDLGDEDWWRPGDAPWDAPGMSVKDFF